MEGTLRARAAPEILVVDDDHDIREMVAEILALDGYRVRSALNGKVALEKARANRPDLIVLDLMMPVMTGWQFLDAQREDPRLATIPVVVVTAALVSHVEGAAVLLRKPFDLDTLLVTVARFSGGGPEHLDQLSA